MLVSAVRSMVLSRAATELAAPVNMVAPSISGTTVVGETLTAHRGTWTGSPTYAYQWLADDVEIDGATASTYELVIGDLDAIITVEVTATNVIGSESATSDGVGPVTAAPEPPVNTVAPSISGSTVVGQTLTADEGTWTGDPTINFTYQWLADDVEIDGATESTYELLIGDVGAIITVEVTGTNGAGSDVAVSAGVGPVTETASDGLLTEGGGNILDEGGGAILLESGEGAADPSSLVGTALVGTAVVAAGTATARPEWTALPSISGTPTEGETLTAEQGTVTGTAPITRVTRWLADDVEIAGDEPTFVLSASEAGALIKIEVTATNAYGNAVAESIVVGPVAGLANSILTEGGDSILTEGDDQITLEDSP